MTPALRSAPARVHPRRSPGKILRRILTAHKKIVVEIAASKLAALTGGES
jgi:hypothetical protein